MIRIITSIFILFCLIIHIQAQQSITDLENKLKSSSGKARFDILYDLTKANLSKYPKKSVDYGKMAIDEAKKKKIKVYKRMPIIC